MHDPDPEILRETLFEVIENQMRANAPPETRKTHDRLLREGHSREETMKMIACVLLNEMMDIQQQMRPFDEKGYVKALRKLPELPPEMAPEEDE